MLSVPHWSAIIDALLEVRRGGLGRAREAAPWATAVVPPTGSTPCIGGERGFVPASVSNAPLPLKLDAPNSSLTTTARCLSRARHQVGLTGERIARAD